MGSSHIKAQRTASVRKSADISKIAAAAACSGYAFIRTHLQTYYRYRATNQRFAQMSK